MSQRRTKDPQQRLHELIRAATTAFCRHGYERTQMADVAREMQVATGTVYLYVESKDALFDLIVRANSEAADSELAKVTLPVKTPEPGATLQFLKNLWAQRRWPMLEAALSRKRADDARVELREVLGEQYALMSRFRVGLLLLTRSVFEFPGLNELALNGLRKRLIDSLVRYIELRTAAGQFLPPGDPVMAAAFLISTLTWATTQRPWDPGFAHFDDQVLEQTVLDALVRALIAPCPVKGDG